MPIGKGAKKVLYLFFILLTTQISNAQKLIIDDSVFFKRGIYKNFKEFRENNPSIVVDFEVKNNYNPKYTTHSRYKIYPKEKLPVWQDSIWGFCDGKGIYIKSEKELGMNFKELGTNFYEKITFLNRYCFVEIIYTFGSIYLPRYKKSEMVLNFNNGSLFPLTKKNVEKILKQDRELYKKYKNDFEGPMLLTTYLKEYCSKHPEEVKR